MTARQKYPQSVSRRTFMRTAAASTASMTFGVPDARGASPDRIRVGVVGCGGRGTGAAHNCVNAAANVEIHAMADLFPDRLETALAALQGSGRRDRSIGDALQVTPDRCFTGWNAYKDLLQTDVDLVILATPPHFRPEHFRAVVEAGKHAFIEKPVAVDPVGVRSVIETAQWAKRKGLAVVAGTQRRHAPSYIEVIKRIHDGAIGELVGGQCYWNTGGLWIKEREAAWSDMETQLRNWLYYTWLSGDHIVEQHIHNVDVINWAFGGMPVKALAMGGRQTRVDAHHGNVFDHFAGEFEYANGARVMSMCRQADGAARRNGERIVGTKGMADLKLGKITGEHPYVYEGPSPNPQVQEHSDLIASIRAGKPLNEGVRVAESTLTVVAARMSAYTGRELKLDWAAERSKLDLRPEAYAFGPLPTPEVAIPGETPLV